MAMFERREDKAVALAEREQAAQEAAAREAEAAFWASPPGQARAAKSSGDRFFQIEIPHAYLRTQRSVGSFMGLALGQNTTHSAAAPDVLGMIEAEGWSLEHASWVFVQTGENSRAKAFTGGAETTVRGDVIGIYLFRSSEPGHHRAR